MGLVYRVGYASSGMFPWRIRSFPAGPHCPAGRIAPFTDGACPWHRGPDPSVQAFAEQTENGVVSLPSLSNFVGTL